MMPVGFLPVVFVVAEQVEQVVDIWPDTEEPGVRDRGADNARPDDHCA